MKLTNGPVCPLIFIRKIPHTNIRQTDKPTTTKGPNVLNTLKRKKIGVFFLFKDQTTKCL